MGMEQWWNGDYQGETEDKEWKNLPQCYTGSLDPHVVIPGIEPEASQYEASV